MIRTVRASREKSLPNSVQEWKFYNLENAGLERTNGTTPGHKKEASREATADVLSKTFHWSIICRTMGPFLDITRDIRYSGPLSRNMFPAGTANDSRRATHRNVGTLAIS